MYKIIGADQKEYGPVSAEQVREWGREGRANGQTRIQAEGTTEWRPLATFPEFADLAGAAPSTPPPFPTAGAAPAAPATPEEILARDYDLDIGSCLGRSWELVKRNFWPVVGITFVVMLVMQAIDQGVGLLSRSAVESMVTNRQVTPEGVLLVFLTWLINLPVQTVLMGGLYMYYLKLIRGQDAGIADAFSGLTSALVPLALLGLVKGLLTLLGFAACVIPGIYLWVAWTFAVPLVIDKQLGFWEAMELSRKVVTKHWFLVFALLLVIGLVGISGIIVCCVGVVVTMAIGWVALMYAYEDIFNPKAP
ncbi:MAG: hypothetical protein JWR69_3911 [Pedosphaera sp.]|nr:hypothetical protein [Pedosphaera sp.]